MNDQGDRPAPALSRYTCELAFTCPPAERAERMRQLIALIDFAPFSMDLHFNEFVTPRLRVLYTPDALISSLSQTEMDGGVNTFSLYDEHYAPQEPTPFFRAQIGDTITDGRVTVRAEWIAYPDLNWLIRDWHLLKVLALESDDLLYCIAHDQSDVFEESRADEDRTMAQRLLGQKNWGRSVAVNGLTFMSAPVMIFGKAYDSIIPTETIRTADGARTMQINSQEFVEVSLFGLYEDPAPYRARQKRYWQTVSLSKRVQTYREQTARDVGAWLQRRSDLKSALARKRN
jgi:hypothetical protein